MRDAAPESYQGRPESLETFEPLTHQARWKTKTMPSQNRFPTLTSDASLNQKTNKQTSHEKQKTLDSSCISFCTSSGKRQLKTSQVDTKLCQSKQLSRCCINFPHELTCQILTNQRAKIGRRAWPTRNLGKERPSPPVFLINWLNFRVHG